MIRTDTTQSHVTGQHEARPGRVLTAAAAVVLASAGLVACGGSTGGSASNSAADTQAEPAAAGGQFATELVGQTDFAEEPDAPQTGVQALQQVTGGRVLLTNLGPGLAWQSYEAAPAPGANAIFVAGELEFTPEQIAAVTPITAAGVGVGSTSQTWDYFLTCNTAGIATLQRSSDTEAVKLAEYDNVGCGQTFTLGLEAHTPANANTELLLTLPDGSRQTVSDDADYGPFSYYGFLVYGDQYPATAAALSGRTYVTPQ